MLSIKTFVEGPIDANNYLLTDEDSREAVLIDCSSSRDEFVNSIKDANVTLKYILLTHGHFDHLLGVDKFKKEFCVETYVSKDDMTQVELAPQMLGIFAGSMTEDIKSIKNFVSDGDEFKIGNYTIKAISTPGHTRGGMCYLVDNKLFSGDTLFQGSVGRCDLPEGDLQSLISGIKNKIFSLPENTEVFPGHGAKTTIGYEKKYNEIINY
ncbi:MBL fold metallo-hydrolase [bacterium]|nr:MBL fold metallo-hydrolase [bacterium]